MTQKSVATTAPAMNTPELLELVSESVREGVARGEYEVLPGKQGDKPVIRYATSKQFVPNVGSGQYPGAVDLGEIAKATGFKRSRPYREAIEALAPWDQGPEFAGSLAWWYEKARWAASGAPQKVDCQHTGCSEKHLVAFKPDGGLIFKFMEMMIGKAPATMDLTVDATLEMLTVALSKRETEVKVITSDPDEAYRRARMIEQRFTSEGDSSGSDISEAEYTVVEAVENVSGADVPEDTTG